MKTNITVKQDKVCLTRFINGKLYSIEFHINVLAKDIAQYFDFSNDLFKQLVR